jgi:nucleotide-binding universal stress UspA family protein
MQGSIIVPLDGSSFGEQALPWAFSIARRAQVPVHLVHVHDNLALVRTPAFALAGPDPDGEAKQDEREYLHRLAERTRFDHDLDIEIALIEGDVADALDQYQRDVQAALIVMSTGNRGCMERFFLGSVTDQLVRRTIPPVLLVHPDGEDPDADTEVHLNHVLLPLESASGSENLARAALEIGSLFKGDCTLFHAIEGRGAHDYAPLVASAAIAERRPEGCVAAAHAHFEPLAELLRDRGNSVGVKVVECPHAAQAVLDEADSSAADWIAISSLRRPRLSQLMFGSIADKIIHGARVPVFVHTSEQG